MSRRYHLLRLSFLPALLAVSAPAGVRACSAILISVKQAVAQSDSIVRAKALSGKAYADDADFGDVEFRVLSSVKGTLKPGALLKFKGRIRDTPAPGKRSVPYDSVNCARAAGCGGCYAYDYKVGAEYLLMLKDGNPYWAPLSPVNEELSGPKDPWLIWVQRQVRRR